MSQTRSHIGTRAERVTINDLASQLGLTKGTVSRALNGYPDIAETTQLRVARQAEKMGYRPLSHAQAMRTGRTRSIGLVLQVNVHDGQRPFLADFLAGVSQSASAENWSLTVATSSSETETLQTIDRLIDERKADGFIVPRTLFDDPRVALLKRANVPFVLFGRTGDAEGCAWFDILGENAMREAVLRLAGFGHKRIGFVNSDLDYNYARLRRGGFDAGMAAAGLAVAPELLRDGAMSSDQGERATRQLLDQNAPPTALVFATDAAALGGIKAARDLDLNVGTDLSIISYDGAPEGAYSSPPLTTFNVDSLRAGARLAALLIERIRGTAPEDLRETAEATLFARASDGRPTCTSAELALRISTTKTRLNA